MISKNHPNKKAFNKLVYDNGDYWLNKLKHHFKGHVYDLGCGKMPYKSWLLGFVDKYTGVDWSDSKHNVSPDIFANLNDKLPIDDESADSIISLSVMEHLCEPQIFLNESFRILKKGGSMVLQVPFMWHVHEAPYDYYRYTKFGLKYLFEKAGFGEVEVIAQSGFWSMFVLKFNYFSVKFIRGPYIVRVFLKMFLFPIWLLGQKSAPILDKLIYSETETIGYYVVGKK